MDNKITALVTRMANKIEKLSTRSSPDLSGARSLFGTIGAGKSLLANGEFGFIPLDGNGKTLDLQGADAANWLGLDTRNMQYWAYTLCSPLAAVIDRLAEADTNGRIGFVDDNLIPIKNPNKNPRLLRIKNLLNKPNPLQTWEEFNSEQVVICKIFGYCPVFAVCPAGMDKSYTLALFNLNPYFALPQYNYNFSLFAGDDITKNNPIKCWIITIMGVTYNIPAEDILLVKDGFINNVIPNNLGLPLSKIAGLDFAVSNICAAMEADNVLLRKKGPLGAWSFDPRPDTVAGVATMTPTQQKDIQDALAKYGLTLGQWQHFVSKQPIKWNPTSFNLRDLMTKETIRQGTDTICDRLGYPAELMSGKNATYENRSSAEKYLYQNNIIPFSLRRMARYDEFFSLDGVSLHMDYNHLPVLQEDIMKAGEAAKAQSEGLVLDWINGIITWNEYRISLDRDPVAGGDIYYSEYIKKFPNEKIVPAVIENI